MYMNKNLLFKKIAISFSLSILIHLTAYGAESNPCSRDKNDNSFTIFSYHEIADQSETLDPTYTVSPKNFAEQIHWLIQHDYHFISIDDILKYDKHTKSLPKNAVLITFDDGYQSVYTHAYPVLKENHIPFVIALVGSWMKEKNSVNFANHLINRDKFLSQKEIKEMVSSGLVEIASHSYNSHNGILGNPQGNLQPTLTTRSWNEKTHSYEKENIYQQRVYNDLRKNNEFLKDYTGQKPRVIVWPYGHYNQETRHIADRLGMTIGLTLDDGSNTINTPIWGLRRILVDQKMTLKDLALNMWDRNSNFTDGDRNIKAAHVDLDYIYDPDPQQQEKNLGMLLDRIKLLGVNTVYLQAFADPDANGAADYVYFPNRNIPMRADLFNRVAWQISTRTQVKRVFAWMPLLAWELPKSNPAAKDTVVTLQVDPSHLNMGYPRLSPFSKKARKAVREIYEDLSKSAYFDGILFHDDVTLSDFEDDSVFARKQYREWGLSNDVMKIRSNHEEFLKWTRLKTQYLDQFAKELSQMVNLEQPGLLSARNLYAQVALNPDAQEWYAQSLSESIANYDYTAIMAMPYMEQAENAREFYDQIVNRVKQQECGLERTIMELQTVNWRNDQPISSNEMSETIDYLYDMGINHIAYYPDNVFKNNPDTATMHDVFSHKPIRIHPFPIQNESSSEK